jgi:hypothetical protein
MEGLIFGQVIVDGHAKRESLKPKSRKTLMTISRGEVSMERLPLKIRKTNRSAADPLRGKKSELRNPADVFYTAADFNREFLNDDDCLECASVFYFFLFCLRMCRDVWARGTVLFPKSNCATGAFRSGLMVSSGQK